MGVVSRVAAALTLGSACASAAFAGEPSLPSDKIRARLETLSVGSEDPRRVSGRFLPNLGRNSVDVFSSHNLAPFAIGAAATGAAALFDDKLKRFFGEKRRAHWLGASGEKLGRPFILTPLAAALYGSGRLAHDGRYRDASYDISQAFLVNAAYTNLIKHVARRERPDESDNLSFLSGHTSNAFAWATVANHHYGPKVGVPSFVVASLVGISRMEKRAHHLSDVVAGASLGYLIGRTVVRRDSEPIGHGVRVQ
jgi:membrane-associated phospholipid phosphatase